MYRGSNRIFVQGFALLLLFLAVPEKTLATSFNAVVDVPAPTDSPCLVTAETLDFGIYDPINGSTATADLQVTCDVPYTIGMDTGGGGGSFATNRRMSGIADGATPAPQGSTAYQLHTRSGADAPVWGLGGGNGELVSADTGTGSQPRVHTVYGRAEAGQLGVFVGLYVASVGVSVNF